MVLTSGNDITVLALISVSSCTSGRNEIRHITLVCVITGTNPQHLRLQNQVAAEPELISYAMHTRQEHMISSSRISGDTVLEHTLLPF
jgi:hypothetical protein